MSAPPKKRRMEPFKRRKFYDKQSQTKKHFLASGQTGVVVTCNFRERDCVREAYGILNEYYDKFYGNSDLKVEENPIDEDVDISEQLEQQIEDAKMQKVDYKFQLVETGTTNFMFIKADVPNILDFITKIFKDIQDTGKSRTKTVLRFVPIEVVTKANMADITDAAGQLFDKYLLKEPKTFAVVINSRFNSSIQKDDVKKELASIASQKNIGNKVDLSNPELAIFVEIVKGHACISVLPDFYKFKKYNLSEICNPTGKAKPDDEKVAAEVKVEVKSEPTETSAVVAKTELNDEKEATEIKVEAKVEAEETSTVATGLTSNDEKETAEVKIEKKTESEETSTAETTKLETN